MLKLEILLILLKIVISYAGLCNGTFVFSTQNASVCHIVKHLENVLINESLFN